MRDIFFEEVGMKNFGPYIDPMVLNFATDHLVLMRGPNGIGKTMALDAIPFTLYGETSKKAKGDDVVNNRIGKNCHTWLKFTINEDVYTLNRYHKYSKYGNTVILNKNGVDTKKGHREVLPEIEKIVCPKKSFMNTLMFGQKVKDFFTDLVDSDKKEIFRKILDLGIYSLYYKKADELLKQTIENRDGVRTQAQISESVIDEINRNIVLQIEAEKQYESDKKETIKSHRKSIEESTRLLESWEKRLEELNQQDHNMESVMTEMTSVLSQLDLSTQERQNDINQVHILASKKEAEVSNAALEAKEILKDAYQKDVDILDKGMREFLKEHQALIDKLTKEKSEITANISSWETTVHMSQRQRDEFQVSVDDESVCPTCLRDMDDECVTHLKDEINSLDKIIKEHQTKIDDGGLNVGFLNKQMKVETEDKQNAEAHHNAELVDYEKIRDHQLKEISDRLVTAIEKVKQFEIEKTQNAIDECEIRNLSGQHLMEELIIRKADVQQVLDKIEEANLSIANIKANTEWIGKEIQKLEESEYDKSQLENHRKRKLQLEVSIQQNQLAIIDLESQIEVYTFWKGAYSPSGIPSMLIDEAIPFMNKQVVDYLDKMTNGRYIVSFDTLASTKAGEFRDKISVHVLDTHTGANSRVQLSGGQTRIIDIATILTLGDLQSNMQSVQFNILLFDEIFYALDDENIGMFLKYYLK